MATHNHNTGWLSWLIMVAAAFRISSNGRLYKSITDPSSLVAKPIGRDKKKPRAAAGNRTHGLASLQADFHLIVAKVDHQPANLSPYSK